MGRHARERLGLDDAKILFGERTLRARAVTRAVYSAWKMRGVPWEIAGPLLLEQLSLTSEAHAELARHGGSDMHAVLEAQGKVFQVARIYGVDSKEFRAVSQLLTLYVPPRDSEAIAPSVPSSSAGPPSHRAVRVLSKK